MRIQKTSLLLAFTGFLATSVLASEPALDVDMNALDRRQNGATETTSSQPGPTRISSTSSTRREESTTQQSTTPRVTSSSTPPGPTPDPTTSSEKESTTSSVDKDKTTTTTTQGPPRSSITSSVPIISSRQSLITRTVTLTFSDGSYTLSEVASSTTFIETTGFVPTTLPSSDSNTSSGLSDGSKKIIAGVVGGVGGAILLGGLAIVAWRMWGRKKTDPDDYDDMHSGGVDSLREKRQSNAGITPFQSTLDQYHTPAPKPNAAANF